MIEAIRRIVFRRRGAYRALFRPGGQDLSVAAVIVLTDLKKFCRADHSTTVVSPVTRSVDPYASALAEGRREVWLRISQHLEISDADLYNLLKDQPEEDN